MIFHQFSYGRDSLASVESIRSIRRLYPDDPIYLWSDSANPIDPAVDYGSDVQIRQTGFRRMGNLNGPECVLGMRECYQVGYDENPGESYHVKLDPDSMLLTTGKIDEVVGAGGYFFCHGDSNSYIMGWFQIHSREFHEDYQKVPCIRQFCKQPSFGEDVVFHEAATKLANGRQVVHQTGTNICLPFHYSIQEYPSAFAQSAVLIYNAQRHSAKSIPQIMSEFYTEFLASL